MLAIDSYQYLLVSRALAVGQSTAHAAGGASTTVMRRLLFAHAWPLMRPACATEACVFEHERASSRGGAFGYGGVCFPVEERPASRWGLPLAQGLRPTAALVTAVVLIVRVLVANPAAVAVAGGLECVESQGGFGASHVPHGAAQNVSHVNVKQARGWSVEALVDTRV